MMSDQKEHIKELGALIWRLATENEALKERIKVLEDAYQSDD